jgi:hypothetical protein
MPPFPLTTLKLPSFSSDTARLNWLAVVPLLWLVALMGVRGAGQDALWYDEWWSVYYAGAAVQYLDVSPADTWARVAGEFHELNPPGYYITLNVWSALTGDATATLRVWSAWVSLLGLAAVYRFGREHASHTAGLVAVVLLAGSAFFVRYTHEARAYPQLAALTALTLWSYGVLLRHPRPPRLLFVVFGVGVMGMLYTHYMAAPVLAMLGLYHLFTPKNRRWWTVTLLALGAFALFVPWLQRATVALQQVDSDTSRDFYALSPVGVVVKLFSRFANGGGLLLAVLLVLAWGRMRLLWVLLIGTLVLAVIGNALVGFLTDAHYLFALFPILAVLGGVGTVALGRRAWGVVAVWALVGLWVIRFPPPLPVDSLRLYWDWPTLVELMQEEAFDYDTVAVLLPQPDPDVMHIPVADFYAHDERFTFTVVDSLPDKLPLEYAEAFGHLTRTTDRFWIAYDARTGHRPNRYALEMRDWLIQEGEILDCEYRRAAPQVDLRLYISPPENGWLNQHEDGLAVGLHQSGQRLMADGTLKFPLVLQRPDTTPQDAYYAVIGLYSDDDTLARELRVRLPESPSGCRYVGLDTRELPAGTYGIYSSLHRADTDERVTPLGGMMTPDNRVKLLDWTF